VSKVVNVSELERGVNKLIANFNKMGMVPRLRRGGEKDPFYFQIILPEGEWNNFIKKHMGEEFVKYVRIRVEFQRLIFEIAKP